jgi:hypothetical protein
VTTETEALYLWLKAHWRQNEPGRLKYLCSTYYGPRRVFWPIVWPPIKETNNGCISR